MTDVKVYKNLYDSIYFTDIHLIFGGVLKHAKFWLLR